MGEAVCEAVEGADDLELAARADPALGVELADVLHGADVAVDFSIPDAGPDNVRKCLEAGVHAVVGTTGFDLEELRAATEGAGGAANCFVAPNFAIGAVLMMQLAQQVAPHMPECEIVELHHDGKLDAPSGTAKRTARLIAEAGGRVHDPIHSIRLPGLVAHHQVLFGGAGQTLSIRHDSTDRRSFMPGVLLAVRRVGDFPRRFTVGWGSCSRREAPDSGRHMLVSCGERKVGTVRSASRESGGDFPVGQPVSRHTIPASDYPPTTTLPAPVPLPTGTRPAAESCEGPPGDAGGMSGLAARSNAARGRSDPVKSCAQRWSQALRCRTAGQVLLLRQHRANLFGAGSGHIRGHRLADQCTGITCSRYACPPSSVDCHRRYVPTAALSRSSWPIKRRSGFRSWSAGR